MQTPVPPTGIKSPQDKPAALQWVEVNLTRKYCPFFLSRGDQIIENNNKQPEYVLPGIVMLHPKDAVTALNAGAARPTNNTYEVLGRV